MTRFEWDPAKAQSNLGKHGISFSEAQTIFTDPLIATVPDPDHSDEEERWLSIGNSIQRRLLLVAHIQDTVGDDEIIRIISARIVTPQERKHYEEESE